MHGIRYMRIASGMDLHNKMPCVHYEEFERSMSIISIQNSGDGSILKVWKVHGLAQYIPELVVDQKRVEVLLKLISEPLYVNSMKMF